jgi:hypothetical protein
VLDADLHIVPIRLAARLCDPDAFVISSAMFKTHNTAIASLSITGVGDFVVVADAANGMPARTPA